MISAGGFPLHDVFAVPRVWAPCLPKSVQIAFSHVPFIAEQSEELSAMKIHEFLNSRSSGQLAFLQIKIGEKYQVPFWHSCYQEDGIWKIAYAAVTERGTEFLVVFEGSEDDAFDYLDACAKIKKQTRDAISASGIPGIQANQLQHLILSHAGYAAVDGTSEDAVSGEAFADESCFVEDLTLKLSDISDENKSCKRQKNFLLAGADWQNVSCAMFLDDDGCLIFVGYLGWLDYPVYAIRAAADKCRDDGAIRTIEEIARRHVQRKKLHCGSHRSSNSYGKGAFGIAHNKMIFIKEFEDVPSDWRRIERALDEAKNAAKALAQDVDWNAVEKKLNNLDEEVRDLLLGRDYYPDISYFGDLLDDAFACLMLSEDGYAKSLYERLICHIRAADSFDSAMRG